MKFYSLLFFMFVNVSFSETTKSLKKEVVENALSGKDDIVERDFLSDATEPYLLKRNGYNYFLAGLPDSKVRFGFKIGLFGFEHLHLNFVQRMNWKLFSKSSPFRNIDYNPSISYFFDASYGLFHGAELGFYDHVSNGRGGEESRSRDGVYVNVKFKDPETSRSTWRFNTRVLFYYNIAKENKDWLEFGEFLRFKLQKSFFLSESWLMILSSELKIGLRDTFSPRVSAIENHLMFRPIKHEGFPGILVRHYYGYGDSFLNYRRFSDTIMVGVVF